MYDITLGLFCYALCERPDAYQSKLDLQCAVFLQRAVSAGTQLYDEVEQVHAKRPLLMFVRHPRGKMRPASNLYLHVHPTGQKLSKINRAWKVCVGGSV